MTPRRTSFWCGATLAAVLGVAALAVALAVFQPQLLLPLVRRALSPRGGGASLSAMHVALNPPSITLSDVAITGRPWDGDLLRLDHFRIEWNPAAFLQGGPKWRRVEVKGLLFERTRHRETKEPPDLTALTRLLEIENLSIDDARLRVALPQGNLSADGLRVRLVPGEGGARRVNGEGVLTLFRNGSVVAAGRLFARGTARDEPAIDLELDLKSAYLDLPWIAGAVSGRTAVRVDRKSLRADDLNLTLVLTRLVHGSRGAPGLGPVRLSGSASAQLDGTDPRLDVRGLDVGGAILVRGTLGGHTPGELSGVAEGEIPRLEHVQSMLAPLFPGPFAEVGLEGKIRFRLSLDARGGFAQPVPRLSAAVAFDQVGFRAPAADAMGRNLSGLLDLEARLGPRPRLNADLAINRGEALWGTVYIDLARHPLALHAAGTRNAAATYDDVVLDGGLAGFGRLAIDGRARREAGGWRHQGRLELSDLRLGPLFRTLVTEPMVSTRAELATFQASGIARLNVAFSGSERAAFVVGRLQLRSTEIRRQGEPPVLTGLDIDLPIAYSAGVRDPGGAEPSGTAGWGRLRVKELRIAGEKLGPLDIPVVLVPNRLYIGGSIAAPLFGGRLDLRGIRVDEPVSPDFRIRLAARISGLDLARIGGKDSILEGRLDGLLDPVLVGQERLTAVGDLAGDLFGGRMEIRGVVVERPFHPGREIACDVGVSLLDLQRVSAALGIGRVTGRLSGSVTGMRVAYGQPVAFHLKLESVPVKGVAQSVSLKAVDSISVVSTGSPLSGLGSSVMTRLFREFPYAKIGIECSLKNDVFTVRGLIREDGAEYLVKRRLLAGIDVVNRNPDNRIGFSDMLERAKRATGERVP